MQKNRPIIRHTFRKKLLEELKNHESVHQMLIQLLKGAKTQEQQEFLRQRIQSKTQEIKDFKILCRL